MTINKNKILKVGIIGGGLNSAVGSAHFSALLLSNRFKIVTGSFSRKKELNIETARLYNVSENHVYANFYDLIEKEKSNVDCVIILTPTDQHLNQVLACIEAEIPVVCEKALAGSIADIVEIQNALKLRNGFLSVIYNYIGYPILRELREYINNNKIGKIHQIQIEMPQEGYLRLKEGKPIAPQEWRLNDGDVPILSLDLGVHLHIIISYLTGETPLKVVSSSHSFGNFPSVIDNINCIIQYSNNMTCNMWYSKVAIGQRNGLRVRVFGATGSAEWFQLDPEVLHMANSEGHRWVVDRGSDEISVSNQARYSRFKVGHPSGFIEALANYYEDIANDLHDYLGNNKTVNSKESFGVKESLEGMKLFESVSRSSVSGTWSEVNEKPSISK